MKNHKNDPRISAYILNELNAEQRSAFEQELLMNSDLSEQLAAFKKNISDVQSHFKNEPQPKLSPDRKEALFHKMKDSKKSSFSFPLGWAGGGFIAASLALIIFNQSLKNEVTRPLYQTEISEADLATPDMKMAHKTDTVNIETHSETKANARLNEQYKDSAPSAAAQAVVENETVAEESVQLGAASAEGYARSRGSVSAFGDAGDSAKAKAEMRPSAIVASKKSLQDSKLEQKKIFIINVQPAMTDPTKDQAESTIKNCLLIDSKLDFEFVWIRKSQTVSVKKSNPSLDEKALECIKSHLQKIQWPNDNDFTFKIHTDSN